MIKIKFIVKIAQMIFGMLMQKEILYHILNVQNVECYGVMMEKNLSFKGKITNVINFPDSVQKIIRA